MSLKSLQTFQWIVESYWTLPNKCIYGSRGKKEIKYTPTCHDDMKYTGLPLLPHCVAGTAEKCAVVHRILRGVAQLALRASAGGSDVRHPAK